jgi:hypothetical protein
MRKPGERSPTVWGVGMLLATVLTVVLDIRWVRGVLGFALMLVVFRSVVAVWSLGFVRPGARVEAVQSRVNLYVLGAMALVCTITLLG